VLLEWVDYYCLVTQTFFCFILPDDVDVADNQTLDNINSLHNSNANP